MCMKDRGFPKTPILIILSAPRAHAKVTLNDFPTKGVENFSSNKNSAVGGVFSVHLVYTESLLKLLTEMFSPSSCTAA
jgi:hypothetical protein